MALVCEKVENQCTGGHCDKNQAWLTLLHIPYKCRVPFSMDVRLPHLHLDFNQWPHGDVQAHQSLGQYFSW